MLRRMFLSSSCRPELHPCGAKADGVHRGLIARALNDALGRLLAIIENFDLLHVLEGLGEGGFRLVELAFEVIR